MLYKYHEGIVNKTVIIKTKVETFSKTEVNKKYHNLKKPCEQCLFFKLLYSDTGRYWIITSSNWILFLGVCVFWMSTSVLWLLHRFSIRLKSGQFSGYSNSWIWLPLNWFLQILVIWHEVEFCLKYHYLLKVCVQIASASIEVFYLCIFEHSYSY